MARVQVKNRSETYSTTHDRRFKPQVYPESQEIATFHFHISNWQRSIDPSSSIVKQVVKWERVRERDVHQKGLVGEQEVYKSFCRPIRSRKTFHDLRPTNETVPLKFFHACTPWERYRVCDYSRVVKWKWRTNREKRGKKDDHGWMRIFFFFFGHLWSRYFLNFFFFLFLFAIVWDISRDLMLKIFRIIVN